MTGCTRPIPTPPRAALLAWLGTILVVVSPACKPGPQAPTSSEPTVVGETVWESCYLHGQKAGYIASSTRKFSEGTRELVEIDSDSQLGVRRFNDRNQINVHTTSVETPLGDVLRFSATTEIGQEKATVRGTVAGRELSLETTSGDTTKSSTAVWPSGTKGFRGVEQSLERTPMQEGEIRELKLLVPFVKQVVVADAQLIARTHEQTKLLEGTANLLHIDYVLKLPGSKGTGIRSVAWADEAGRIIKTLLPGVGQETFRTTREQALEAPKGMEFDLLLETVVKVARPLPPAGQIRRAVYRVELDGDDPSALFPETPQQHVKKLGPNTAEITVTAPSYQEQPDDTSQPSEGAAASDQPTADDSAPNNMIESDDPTIATLAADARGEATDPLAVARALEAYVHHTVKEKNFSQVFASALEVADSHEGDCTEHAVLLTALARALGMPARVVVGLVYVPSQQGFAYHMWTEIYDGKTWLPLDATVGRGTIGAGYLELGTSSLKDATGLAELLSVVQVLGKLKIEVVEES